jgi:hypothetical protein
MSALASPVQKELRAILAEVTKPESPDVQLVIDFGPTTGNRPRLGGAFFTGSHRGFGLALAARAAGLVTWTR